MLAVVALLVGCVEGAPTPPRVPDRPDAALPPDASVISVPDAGDRCPRVLDEARVTVPGELSALLGVRTITGTLTIAAGGELSALACLERVGGDVVISGARELTELAGLAALTEIGGALRIEVSPALTGVDLPALERVGGDLHVDGNRALVRLTGLGRLHTVGGRITITNNPVLREVDALAALTAVGGLTITFDPALETIAGFDALTELDGSLHLHLIRATDTRGLTRLTTIRGDLELGEHVGAFGGGWALEAIEGELRVGGDQLSEVVLPALRALGGLRHLFGGVTRIALPALASMSGDVALRDTPALHTLSLPALATTTGTITVRGNALLARVELDALVRAAGIDVAGAAPSRPVLRMPRLEVVEGPLMLEGVDARGVELARLVRARTLFLRDDELPARLDLGRLPRTALITLAGNGGVEAVALTALEDTYDLSLVDQPLLAAVELPALAVMGGRLVVSGNTRLAALEAPRLRGRLLALTLARNPLLSRALLPELTDAGALAVRENGALEALGLPALARVDRELTIVDNARLSTCEAERLRDRVQAARGIGGRIEISGNAPCP